ncbi:MAG: hypothetical protein V3U67_01865 [Gemmatimonadota bacterium]
MIGPAWPGGLILLWGLTFAGDVRGARVQEEAPGPPVVQDEEPAILATKRCTMTIRFGRSFSQNVGGERESFIHYLGGSVRTVCGDATITADSAVHYERSGRVNMIGRVHYADSTRVLDADRLTYFAPQGRVLAERNVSLTQRRTGSQMRGPRVEIFRGRAGAPERTRATERPHLTLAFGPASESREPFEIDSDEAEFVGEERANVFGGVEINRSDMSATADSAFFEATLARGRLFGDPVVRGEDVELKGDSVYAFFGGEELTEIRALGTAEAAGDDFRIGAPIVAAEFEESEVRRLRAHAGRATGWSKGFRADADSLVFHVAAGALDSLVGIGSASGIQLAGDDTEVEGPPGLGVGGGESWVAGDTLVAIFVPTEDSRAVHSIRAEGNARSYYEAVRDSTSTAVPSRNYISGQTIEVLFEAGEVAEVVGDQAIGVYLEPRDDE